MFEQVLEQVTAGTKALRTGPKLDRSTDIGPMISEAEARRVEEWVEEARSAGATVHAGGRRRGAFYEPTVLTDVFSRCRVIRDEVFGSVVSILPYIEVQDAIYEANNSEYCLQAGIFTQSIDGALAMADKLHVGTVVINGTSDVRIDSMPFGGFKKSGVGREGVRHAVHEMTQPKNTIINLAEPGSDRQSLGGLTETTRINRPENTLPRIVGRNAGMNVLRHLLGVARSRDVPTRLDAKQNKSHAGYP